MKSEFEMKIQNLGDDDFTFSKYTRETMEELVALSCELKLQEGAKVVIKEVVKFKK